MSPADNTLPSALLTPFDSLPDAVREITVRDAGGDLVWHFERGPMPLPTFSVQLPVHASAGGALGTLEVRLLGDAVLAPGGGLSAAIGAVVAVVEPVDGASLRGLPFDPSALATATFEWEGETWVAERYALLDPRLDVVSAAPLAEFASPFESAARRGLAALAVVALLATALAAGVTRRMTRSLGQLAAAADTVSRGDLAVRVLPGGGDEVGRVAHAFNRMSENLQRTLAELSQREALAAVGSFASELAHEVRNPLTAIKVDMQFVEERLPEGSELRGVQRTALEEVARLDRTVAGVLQIARSGRIALEPVDVREPLAAAVRALEPLARQAGATLRVDLAEAPLIVLGDRGALRQLFNNLLVNAAQAVGEGGRIDVCGRRDEAVIVVTVRDDGPGVPPDQLTRIREPFFSTRPEGTGLGLAIADRIAAAHHAVISIESEAGAGTTVAVVFGPSLDASGAPS